VRPLPVWRLELADGVTIANAVFGFLAVLTISVDPALAARLILLAAVADGLDGVLARTGNSSTAGELLDSLADIVSFGVAPALFVYGLARVEWSISVTVFTPKSVVTLIATSLFVVMAVVRTSMYMTYDFGEFRAGVPNTLAATILAVTYLTGLANLTVLLIETVVLSYLMIARIPYPGVCPRDGLGIGALQTGVVLVPGLVGRWLARVLFVAAIAYLVFAPVTYRERGIKK
jgi:archaetidylserine synthase